MAALQKSVATVVFLVTWFALITQLWLMVNSGAVTAPAELIIRFFSYFTILSNLLAAVCATVIVFSKKQNHFFQQQSTQTAIAVYIFIVGLIYNIILRSIWNPQGMQKLVDELLHVINPILFIVYWALFSTQQKIKSNSVWRWWLFPFVYVFFVLIRGNFSGFYPYPFLEINKIGFNKVMINCVGVLLVFIITSFIFLFLGNTISGIRKIKIST